MARNTVGVKNPVSNEDFAHIVVKGENRLGLHLFFSQVVVSKVVTHKPDCMCLNVCLNRKLDALIAKSEESLDVLQASFDENTEAAENAVSNV